MDKKRQAANNTYILFREQARRHNVLRTSIVLRAEKDEKLSHIYTYLSFEGKNELRLIR
jgi:hypothetical protein